MAKLPTYTDLGPAPAPQPNQAVIADRAGTEANDAEARAVSQVGRDLQGVSNELWAFKEKTDTIRVEDAWNQYKNAAVDLTAGQNGLLKTKGADAVNGDLLGKSTTVLTDARKRIADGLTDEQRRRFFERADVTDLDTKKQVLAHLGQQQVEYAKIVFQGSEAAAKSQVEAAPTDPGVFNQARETLLAQADQYLKQNGVTDKGTADSLKDKLTDSLWATRINTLLYSNPALAASLFRANQGAIKDPELKLVIQNKVREADLAVTAVSEADRIIMDFRSEQPPPAAAPAPRQAAPVTTGSLQNDQGMRVSPELQAERDRQRLRLLRDEQRDNPGDKNIEREIRDTEAALAKGPQPSAQRVAVQTAENLAPATNGLPNSRDIAAQLPLLMTRVTAAADKRYGTDPNNPDRAAFIKRLSSELQSKVSHEVQQLNAIQREAQGNILDAIMGVRAGVIPAGGPSTGLMPITSEAQIVSNPALFRDWQRMDSQAKLAALTLIDRNLRAGDKGDEVLYRELFNRIHLEPGDPNKIDFYQQIVDPRIANRLSIPQIQQLRQELDRNETPGGRSLNQMRKAADSAVSLYFKTNVMFTAQPERQIAATMRWNEEAGKKIDQYAKEGKDVRSLFMLDSKDSIVSPAYLQTFVNSTPAQGLAEGAAAVKAGALPANIARAPATIKTPADAEAWIKTLPPGTTMFVDPSGQVRQIPPRAAEPAAPAAEAPPVTMNAEGKLVTPPPAAPPASTEPKMPTLVEQETEAQRYARAKAEAEVRAMDNRVALGGAIAEGVKQAPNVGEAILSALPFGSNNLLKRGTDALGRKIGQSLATDPELAVLQFRTMVRAGTYTPGAESTIHTALETGTLTPAETKIAAGMLRAIADKRGK